VSISSATAPDLDAVCRALVGREVVAAERIGAGRNSRVFRVQLAPDPARSDANVVVKFYRRDPGDARDRLASEFNGLRFLWQNDVRAIPYPIASDRERYCAVYEYIAGVVPDARHVAAGDIDASVRFLSELKALRHKTGSAELPIASEACFTLGEIAATLVGRVERLRATDRTGDGGALHEWLDTVFGPLLGEALDWCRDAAARAGIGFDDAIAADSRTISPSDFGFHNAIRRPDGSLAFVDFEYFGWDDPAKTVADFVLHPGMPVADDLKRRFAAAFLAAFSDVPRLADRARIVYPMFGLKWCVILLNAFLPDWRAAASAPGSTDAVAVEAVGPRAAQLAKAAAMAERIRREYRDNAVLAQP
jgi:Phosphotransferase enzyme family